jgi:alpha-tubulin suppressor-like RCC1 family protein
MDRGLFAIAAGGAHTCAVLTTGDVMCWGSNAEGQLGIGSTSNTRVPSAVDIGTGKSHIVRAAQKRILKTI